MQREEYTVGSWCSQWFRDNRCKWNPRTEGSYRNLIEHHITPGIGEVGLSQLDEQTITDFYESLHSKGLNNRSVWCVHLLLRVGQIQRYLNAAEQNGVLPMIYTGLTSGAGS